MEKKASYHDLLEELAVVRIQLEEATDTIEAIRSGEIDALVVKSGNGHQLYTLKSADQTYRIFIEQMTEGAATLNREGNILYCNSRFAFLVELPLEKVIGQPFYKFITGSCQQKYTELIHSAWSVPTKDELALSVDNFREIPVLVSLKTLDLDEGLSMSVIITDLTGQKTGQAMLLQKNRQLESAQQIARQLNENLENTVRERTKDLEQSIREKTYVEEELRSNQEQLTRILETMAEGVIILNINGVLNYANPMAQKILGLTKNNTRGDSYQDPGWPHLRIDGTTLPEAEHPMSVAFSSGEPVFDYEISIQPPHTERFYISINAAPIRDERGMLMAVVATLTDVTHRRKAIQHKDEFISVASHELRTPITSLKASLQLLNRMKDKPSQEMFPRLIEQANKSLNKVSVLIDDLLNASKITEGQLYLNKQLITLSGLVNDCCPHIRAEGSYQLITTGDLKLQVLADADKVDQVLVNLMNNAVKYAPASVEIMIHIEQTGQWAKVSVTDHGPGISPDKLPYLFDRYYRIDANGNQYSGLGLGLYISAEIIKKHGGQIGAESNPGEGTTFWFTLPLAAQA